MINPALSRGSVGICIRFSFDGTKVHFDKVSCQCFSISMPPVKTTWPHEKRFLQSFLLCSDCWNLSAEFAGCIRLRITCCHWVNVTPALSQPLVEHLFIYFPIYNQCGIQNHVGGSSWPAGQSAQLHALQWKLNLPALLTAGDGPGRSQTAAPDSFFLFLQSQSGGNILISVGERLRADAAVKKKEGKKERWENEQNTAINAGPSLWVCTHACTRAYIRGLRSLRHSKNTHNATGEAGRRVRVSHSITPLLSLHLSPFVSPTSLLLSFSSSSTTVVVPVAMPCLFSKKKTQSNNSEIRLARGTFKKKTKNEEA